MKLYIKKKEEEVVVSFAKENLSINIGEDALENNVNWNTATINSFLIKLASSTLDDELIELVVDDEKESESYKHIVSLFEAFIDEYNK